MCVAASESVAWHAMHTLHIRYYLKGTARVEREDTSSSFPGAVSWAKIQSSVECDWLQFMHIHRQEAVTTVWGEGDTGVGRVLGKVLGRLLGAFEKHSGF